MSLTTVLVFVKNAQQVPLLVYSRVPLTTVLVFVKNVQQVPFTVCK